jgi:Rod binding domain-containing protein
MNVNPLQRQVAAADIAPERLAGNSRLTGEQKIAEASRQFEAMLLRQILSESQKPVIQSESSDNSTATGIYQDLITNTLADNISKSGAFGLARTFEQQLNHRASAGAKAGHGNTPAELSASPARAATARPGIQVADGNPSAPHSHRTISYSVKQP